jgi:hypothetical protein
VTDDNSEESGITETLDFPDGCRVRVRQEIDGTVRVRLDDAPYTLEAASLRRGTKGTALAVFRPVLR